MKENPLINARLNLQVALLLQTLKYFEVERNIFESSRV